MIRLSYFIDSKKTIWVIKMDRELSFERKISFEPLLISIFFGSVVAIIVYTIFPMVPIFALIIGILVFGIDNLVIFPRSLEKFYDYWSIDKTGIYYSDYDTWSKQLLAIFLPMSRQLKRIPFEQIKSFAIVDGENIMNTQVPDGGKLNNPLARKTHYLIISTVNKKVCLHCAWTSDNLPVSADELKRLISFLNSKM